ncbi:LRR domain containing protein, partial [Parasponia andersonii]
MIPKWFLNIATETLSYLNLSHNSFNNWEEAQFILPWKNLMILDLRSNKLQGSLVIPPMSTEYFFISENNLSGRVHTLFCNLSNLIVLDVSNNHLGGTIPPCFGSFSRYLSVLNMKGNNFHGNIPQIFSDGSNLMTLDLSHNQLQGKLPKLLVKCKALQ